MRYLFAWRLVNRDLAIPMLHKAFESGVNYIDTAVGYCNQDSQRVVGEALKGWRDRIVVSTKNHYYGDDESAWRRAITGLDGGVLPVRSTCLKLD